MEISQIRYFLALCDERRFTRAARRCGVAQPSLTRAIKKLNGNWVSHSSSAALKE
jgi:DNA-binding transcriptional LysR family regulator